MGLFDLSETSSPETVDYTDIVAHYKRLRPTRLRLNNELVRRLPSDVLREGAKRIGMLHRGTLVFDSEEEMSVLMDYCIYHVHQRGRNAVERYLCDCPPDPDSDEMACLRAMQHATYTMVALLRVERGVGCHVQNLFTDELRLLVDMGLSKSAKRGGLVATRLLDFGSFVTTGGAALPMAILDEEELDEWQRNCRAGVSDNNFDPAALIRAFLQGDSSSSIRCQDVEEYRQLGAGTDSALEYAPAQRKRALAKHRASQNASKRRCPCGSGRMFKNCCGKR